MAQAAQATFEIPAEALEFQPQVFPTERGEVLHQQPLATGKRLPVQAPPRSRPAGRRAVPGSRRRPRSPARPWSLGILRARREERLAGLRPRVDQRLLAQVDPAPGHQQAEGSDSPPAGAPAAASRVARSGGTAAPRQPRRLPGRRIPAAAPASRRRWPGAPAAGFPGAPGNRRARRRTPGPLPTR